MFQRNFGFLLRIFFLGVFILLSSFLLLSKLYQFQIKDSAYSSVPQKKRVILSQYGLRGIITDRNNIELATNKVSYRLYFFPFEILEKNNLKYEIENVFSVLKTDIFPILEKEHIFLEKTRTRRNLKRHILTYGYKIPFVLKKQINREQFLLFSELKIAGLSPEISLSRKYPYEALACHILGYVKKSQATLERDSFQLDYEFDKTIGISGLEKQFDSFLQPLPKIFLIDEERLLLRDFTAHSQKTLALTIDARIQSRVESYMRSVGRGAAIVMSPETGEILAMVSVPNYDPNILSSRLSPALFETYRENSSSPFLNRCIETYTPGSVFKLIIALEALKNGFNGQYECMGYTSYGDHKIRCWIAKTSKRRHGVLNLNQGISVSCNTFFNQLVQEISFQNVVNLFSLFRFGEKTGIELPNEKKGIIPGSDWWKFHYRVNQKITPIMKAFLSIGQGDSSATPLQISAMTSCIANGGKYYRPSLIHHSSPKMKKNSNLLFDLKEFDFSSKSIEKLRKAMRSTVSLGTMRSINSLPYSISGKTGTAQANIRGKSINHTWATTFAPYNKPRYVVTVLIDYGESSNLPTLLAGKILEACFLSEMNQSLFKINSTPEYYGHGKINQRFPFRFNAR